MRIFKLSLAPAALFTALALAGCATHAPAGYKDNAVLPTEHYTAHVEQTPDQVALAVHAEGLSPAQRKALSDFAGRWRIAGGGAVTVTAPSDAANPEVARTMAYAVQSHLEVMGVPSDHIRLSSYQSGDPRAPVLASFDKAVAVGPDCSGGWDNLTSTMSNEPYHHFGCALTANLAAQVADPRDLVTPPDLAAGDNSRRQVVLAKYREGKATASEKDDQASGAVSSAIK